MNGNRISATINTTDLGLDRIDNDNRSVLTSPTQDSFGSNHTEYFKPGINELIFAVAGDVSEFDQTGLEFTGQVQYFIGGECPIFEDGFEGLLRNQTISNP